MYVSRRVRLPFDQLGFSTKNDRIDCPGNVLHRATFYFLIRPKHRNAFSKRLSDGSVCRGVSFKNGIGFNFSQCFILVVVNNMTLLLACGDCV